MTVGDWPKQLDELDVGTISSDAEHWRSSKCRELRGAVWPYKVGDAYEISKWRYHIGSWRISPEFREVRARNLTSSIILNQ